MLREVNGVLQKGFISSKGNRQSHSETSHNLQQNQHLPSRLS